MLNLNQTKRGKQLPIGYGIFGNNNSPMVFDNKPFFMNSIEYLMDDNNLIETRSKIIKLRQLNNTAVKEIEPNHSGALFSGDDGMFFPSKSWGNSDKVKLVNELSKKDASKYRVTFVPTKYADGSLISTSNRSEYVVKAEKVEKALRSKVTGVGSDKINFHRAKDMIFAIDYIPTKDGQGVFNLIVKGKELTESELSILRKSFKENLDEGSVAGEVIH